MKGYRIQPRIPGLIRIGSYEGLLPEIDRRLKALARTYGVRPSWVKATILAKAVGVSEQPDFRLHVVRKRRKRRA